MKIVKVIYDLETTGLDHMKCAIVQLACRILVNDEVKVAFSLDMAPFPGAQIDEKALEVIGKTESELFKYGTQNEAFQTFINHLDNYIDRYDRDDKAFLVGYNNAKFDDQFLRRWFEINKDRFFGSWFHSNSVDVMALASEYLITRRHYMPNFKLVSVANELGIPFNPADLHDAFTDLMVTHKVYSVVTGRRPEPAYGRGCVYVYFLDPEGEPRKCFKEDFDQVTEGTTVDQITYMDYKEKLKKLKLFDSGERLYDPLF